MCACVCVHVCVHVRQRRHCSIRRSLNISLSNSPGADRGTSDMMLTVQHTVTLHQTRARPRRTTVTITLPRTYSVRRSHAPSNASGSRWVRELSDRSLGQTKKAANHISVQRLHSTCNNSPLPPPAPMTSNSCTFCIAEIPFTTDK